MLSKVTGLIILLTAMQSLGIANAKSGAARGYQFLLNGNYTGCGIPLTVLTRASRAQKLVPKAIQNKLFASPFEEFLQPVNHENRQKQGDNIPRSVSIFKSAREHEVLNVNCLSCHSDRLDGQTIIGLGNRSRDFTQNLLPLAQALTMFAWSPKEKEELRLFQRSIQAIAPYMQAKTIGVNPAINITYALFSQRHFEDFTWSPSPVMPPPPRDFPPVAVPPWWRMKSKDSMFYNGEFTSQHHRVMSLAAAFCMDDASDIRALEDEFRDVEVYIRSLKAPTYPGTINDELAAHGERIFNQTCSSCHGTYGPDGDYPELIIPIEVIGTDPALMEQQTGEEYARFRKWGAKAFTAIYDEHLSSNGKRGYLAPSLEGVWAIAPYFHNGSVPSLAAVLNSKIRPKVWRKIGVGKDQDYDVKAMRVRYEALTFQRYRAAKRFQAYIYDTSLPGYGNQGHTFGDEFSPEERRAVLEYLKTL
ncbi:MAG: hypothetical protein ACOH5I_01095 [Oligoflexus sp.]